jgi:hypothetical protein
VHHSGELRLTPAESKSCNRQPHLYCKQQDKQSATIKPVQNDEGLMKNSSVAGSRAVDKDGKIGGTPETNGTYGTNGNHGTKTTKSSDEQN